MKQRGKVNDRGNYQNVIMPIKKEKAQREMVHIYFVLWKNEFNCSCKLHFLSEREKGRREK